MILLRKLEPHTGEGGEGYDTTSYVKRCIFIRMVYWVPLGNAGTASMNNVISYPVKALQLG